ncbi:bifunctional diaminohydroxyphosphoribosylaminopyrimidine deaminase/5-amino-6-(5-phosphoribosylamino)uracil reductase RibD [Alkalicoccus halolimnae]|uniref:Riboflavin biosynthesis protein RibD n=1 Tax=Alkalicoccus halolimnae TaxID=1667239 RepID=A0A5C7FH67_9BACI|nr:bifunctional diaminohydroxyphosphoribosylaminopyrimidine deaminase/5-amino-6-(5-phosphoribosylamino)uracil reductase RibD [Alkalicoccus halolimnae]TXF83053.1 bifunctional diaminohydroxyphosphoribosylaminopyrimidine deaminase/5-amino-6-(5-phosphoribosylamino)uracil reductase RibD [Alkalicoccus halolimnae]
MNEKYMHLAVQMARAAAGQTSPNPLVGAVIVKEGEVVGLGAHLKAGEKHAERHALDMAGEKASGAEMYVTLEPCSHTGRTPPCADAIINAGIKKVYVASHDPNPQVAGQGIRKLEAAGINVQKGILKKEAEELNYFFFHFIQTKTPYVTLKMAASIDGKTATSQGESKWITGEESRQDGHQLRHEHDAILVGIETVLADNPSLTTRISGGGSNPLRIILDSKLRTPADARLVTDKQSTWIFATEQCSKEKVRLLRSLGVKVTVLSGFSIDIKEVLEKLGEAEITSLLVEGGGTVHDSFVTENLFQRVVLYTAPILIGGRQSPQSVAGNGIGKLSEAAVLQLHSSVNIGSDVRQIFLRKDEN